jgi:chorismate mutase
MKYNVKWIIDGNITISSDTKEEAETKIKEILENIINDNKVAFEKLGARAIQGSAKEIK